MQKIVLWAFLAVFALMLVAGLMYIGAFEFVREGGRKPFIIHDYMYSTSIRKGELENVRRQGVLQAARWVDGSRLAQASSLERGREVFTLLCLPCHAIGGPMNDIRKLAAGFSRERLAATFDAMGEGLPYMPPFAGNAQERAAVIDYIGQELLPAGR